MYSTYRQRLFRSPFLRRLLGLSQVAFSAPLIHIRRGRRPCSPPAVAVGFVINIHILSRLRIQSVVFGVSAEGSEQKNRPKVRSPSAEEETGLAARERASFFVAERTKVQCIIVDGDFIVRNCVWSIWAPNVVMPHIGFHRTPRLAA